MARQAIALVAATLALTVAAQAALAQTAGTATRRAPPHQIANVPLKAPPSNFPLPLPPGYKFIMGYESQYEKQRPTTFLRVHSSSDMGGLRDWYATGLTGMGWKVAPQSGGGRILSVNARKPPNETCLIQLAAVGSGQGGTDIMITFSH